MKPFLPFRSFARLPGPLRLALRLLPDPRVPTHTKAIAIGTVALVGQGLDVMFIVAILDRFIRSAPPEVVREHAAALDQGLPVVIVPIAADQPQNAARCASLGVGVIIGPEERTPTAIRAAVREVLTNPTYRAAAGRMRDEMAALPGPEHAVELLERLAVEKRPLLTA